MTERNKDRQSQVSGKTNRGAELACSLAHPRKEVNAKEIEGKDCHAGSPRLPLRTIR